MSPFSEFLIKLQEEARRMTRFYAQIGVEEIVVKPQIFDQLMVGLEKETRIMAMSVDEKDGWPKCEKFTVAVDDEGGEISVRRGREKAKKEEEKKQDAQE